MLKRGYAMKAAGFGIAIYACSGALEARAADMPLYGGDPTPQTKVEFGTGWYIRGDIGYANQSMPAILPDLSTVSTDRVSSYTGGLGFGYKFNNWIRADLVGDYRQPNKATGPTGTASCVTQITNNGLGVPQVTATDTCSAIGAGSVWRWDVLANAYVDLGTWYGWTPYVGVGAGMSFTQAKSNRHWYMSNGLPYQVSTDGFYFNWDSATQNLTEQFAWALMAGAAYQLTDSAFVDVGYRYVNLGKYSYLSSTGSRVSLRDDAHEFRVGIRYMADWE
jgi:opacity protein-like surface antigen